MLEESAHNIDMEIASELDKDYTEIAESLYSFGKNWQQAQVLKEKIESCQSCVVLSRNEEEKKISERDLISAEEDLNRLSYEPLTLRTGPVVSGLDRILDKYNITPQCYHSRSFIGNHSINTSQPKYTKNSHHTL